MMSTKRSIDIQSQIIQHEAMLSLRTIIFHQAIADSLGLHITDHKCLMFLLNGPQTAGYLAKQTGLTSGGTTAAIDRLEKAGYVKRIRGAKDRRQVLIEADRSKLRRLQKIFAPLGDTIAHFASTLTQGQLIAVQMYLHAVDESLQQQTQTLQAKFQGKR